MYSPLANGESHDTTWGLFWKSHLLMNSTMETEVCLQVRDETFACRTDIIYSGDV